MSEENGKVTWKKLEEGCAYGRAIVYRVAQLEKKDEAMAQKLDRLTWALVAAALTFGTSALFLALNLIW